MILQHFSFPYLVACYPFLFQQVSKQYILREGGQNSKIKAEESFSILEQGYTLGKLLDGTECQILLHTGAIKTFMLKVYCLYFH